MFSLTPSYSHPLVSKGVQLKLENGYTVSIQWGTGNYCQNYGHRPKSSGELLPESETAETAVIDAVGNFVSYKGNDVQARQTVEDVIQTLALVASWPKE
jgi:hypothetical protein